MYGHMYRGWPSGILKDFDCRRGPETVPGGSLWEEYQQSSDNYPPRSWRKIRLRMQATFAVHSCHELCREWRRLDQEGWHNTNDQDDCNLYAHLNELVTLMNIEPLGITICGG
jgi:hypothetical protein